MSDIKNSVRPSAMPKLKECRCYEGSFTTSEAAERGTRVDEVLRMVWEDAKDKPLSSELVLSHEMVAELAADEQEAIMYGVQVLMRYQTRFGDVQTMEQDLAAVSYSASVASGTMDALTIKGKTVIDIKTGQIRDYEAQMAAYSLACMREHFEGDWNYALIFVDQGEVREGSFTFAEAEKLIEDILNKPLVPTPCQYCTWCGKMDSCVFTQRQVEVLGHDVTQLPQASTKKASLMLLPGAIAAMVEDEQKAWEFLGMFSVAEAWKKVLTTKLKEKADKQALTHFTLVKQAGRKTVCSLAKLTEHFEGDVPDGLINQGASIIQLRRVSEKKKLELSNTNNQQLENKNI